MTFITTAERVGRREGLRLGIESVLEIRFGEAGTELLPQIEIIQDLELLTQILKSLKTVKTVEEVQQMLRALSPIESQNGL